MWILAIPLPVVLCHAVLCYAVPSFKKRTRARFLQIALETIHTIFNSAAVTESVEKVERFT